MGERYRRFVEQTSSIPGAALLSGRQHFDPAEDVPWLAILIGTVLTIVLVNTSMGLRRPSVGLRHVPSPPILFMPSPAICSRERVG